LELHIFSFYQFGMERDILLKAMEPLPYTIHELARKTCHSSTKIIITRNFNTNAMFSKHSPNLPCMYVKPGGS